ncbi:hypothetical protein NW768_004544 [Fusarium equiseti]|uniref:Uncharacterized protein n=1 Tax=Fusarium equiseti TaxID=61235 RepID=A0ABQ8RGI4_FUSEQ|nr:hypothetical protein NW768_004544 [Fusarium equiseti]
MSQRSFGGSSVYSSDSTWTTTYKRIPKKQPMAIRFLSWAAGAPSGATALKKRTRDFDDNRSVRSGGSSFSYWNEPETQLYWVAHPHGYDYSGSSRGSNAGSSRSKRSGRSSKGSGGGSRKHFDGAVPRPPVQPMGMPMPMPMNAGPPPPPAPMGPPMDGGFDPGFEGGYDDGVYDQGQGYDPGYGGGYSPAHMHGPTPMPPPPMNAPMPDAAPFINVTGQNQPGNPFQGGRGGPRSESEWSSDWSDQEM